MAILQVQARSFATMRELGRLHKGEPKPEGGKKFGADLDCFRFTSDDPAVMAAFKAAYGSDRVRELHVYLPYARLEANWDYWFETWGGGSRIKYRCNGQDWVKWLMPDGKTYSHDPRPCPICAKKELPKQGEHKPTSRLTLLLPALLKAGHVGVVLLTSTAWSDLYSINGTFKQIEEQRTDSKIGDLRGIELILRRELRDIPTQEHGVQKKNVVVLETMADWVQAQLARAAASTMSAIVDAGTGERVNPATGELLEEPEPPQDDDEDAPKAEAEQKAEVVDWRKSAEHQDKVRAVLAQFSFTREETAAALGVDKISAFPGSFDDLMARLTDYGMAKAMKAAEAKQAEAAA